MEITVSEIKPQIHGDRCGTEVTVFSNIPFEQIMLRDGRIQDALALMDRLEKKINSKSYEINSIEVVNMIESLNSYNPKNK